MYLVYLILHEKAIWKQEVRADGLLKAQVEEIIRLKYFLFDGKCGGSYLRIYCIKKQNQTEYFWTIQSGTTHLAYDKIKSCEIMFRNFLGRQVSLS